MSLKQLRFGFLGGSFDPVHFGHLLIAQDAFETMGLERVYFIPAAQNPHKILSPYASKKDRLAMLKLTIEEDSRFSLIDLEFNGEEVSYTIDTVRKLRERFVEDQLFWIIGSDQVAGLHTWHNIQELVKLTKFICMQRFSYEPILSKKIEGLCMRCIDGHIVQFSSTEIRKRIKNNQDIKYFLPSSVEEYIQKHFLYR
jgi:nicotinate-nucleotide adenylyltransferase